MRPKWLLTSINIFTIVKSQSQPLCFFMAKSEIYHSRQAGQEGNISRDLFSSDVLRPVERQDLQTLGINTDVVKSVDRQRMGIAEVPTGYFTQMENGQFVVRGHVYTEVGVKTGEDHDWTGRVFFFPQDATKNGAAVELPSFVMEDGFQVLIHNTPDSTDEAHTIRMDSVCKTSMYDGGHVSSAGIEGLGCDCSGQRTEAKKVIMQSPRGLSILSPMEGRGNGQRVHVQQIQIQNYMARAGQEVPDTYQAVEALGHKRDPRSALYFLEALIIRELFDIDKINLLSNNPEKSTALAEAGINVKLVDLTDVANPGYYSGLNAKAKAMGGHTGLARITTLFARHGKEK